MEEAQQADPIATAVDEALCQQPDLFLLNLKKGRDTITITIDGDKGVTLQQIVRLSKAVEQALGNEDWSLTVSSPGAAEPLVLPRQYPKHVGRTLKGITQQGEWKGTLQAAKEDRIVVEIQVCEKKEKGKGYKKTVKQIEVLYTEIEKATVVIS